MSRFVMSVVSRVARRQPRPEPLYVIVGRVWDDECVASPAGRVSD